METNPNSRKRQGFPHSVGSIFFDVVGHVSLLRVQLDLDDEPGLGGHGPEPLAFVITRVPETLRS
jgi:hypothetical protein